MLLLLVWLFWWYHNREEDGGGGGEGTHEVAEKLLNFQHNRPSHPNRHSHPNANAELSFSENLSMVTENGSDELKESYILTLINDIGAGAEAVKVDLEVNDGVFGLTVNDKQIVEEHFGMSLTNNQESEFEMNFDDYLDTKNALAEESEIPSTGGFVEEEVVSIVSDFVQSQFENDSLLDYDLQLESLDEDTMTDTALIDLSHLGEVLLVPVDLHGQYSTNTNELQNVDVDRHSNHSGDVDDSIFDGDFEFSESAAFVTSGHEEVMEASVLKNRLSSLIEHQNQGYTKVTGVDKCEKEKIIDSVVMSGGGVGHENKTNNADINSNNNRSNNNNNDNNNINKINDNNSNSNNRNNSNKSKNKNKNSSNSCSNNNGNSSGISTNNGNYDNANIININSANNNDICDNNSKGSAFVRGSHNTYDGTADGACTRYVHAKEVKAIQSSAAHDTQSTGKSKAGKKNIEPRKLEGTTCGTKQIMTLNQPSTKLTDFDKVMRSRKMHTDTMDITATVLGNLGRRKEKIKGKKLSKHWDRLHNAVSKREYLTFADKETPLNDGKKE